MLDRPADAPLVLALANFFGRELERLQRFSRDLQQTIAGTSEAQVLAERDPDFGKAAEAIGGMVREIKARGQGIALIGQSYTPIPPVDDPEAFISQAWHEVGPEVLLRHIRRAAGIRDDCLELQRQNPLGSWGRLTL